MRKRRNGNTDLAYYLHARLECLIACNAEFESNINDKERELCRRVDKGEFSKNDPEVGRIVHHLQAVLGNTFRYTLLSGVCTFMEEAVKEITKRLVTGYSLKLRATKKGNFLNKHIELLKTHASLDVGPIQADLDKFNDMICVRNCIVHAWGKVSEASNPQAVKDAVKRIQTASISADGYLLLDDQVLPDAIITAENISDAILQAKLGTSMT